MNVITYERGCDTPDSGAAMGRWCSSKPKTSPRKAQRPRAELPSLDSMSSRAAVDPEPERADAVVPFKPSVAGKLPAATAPAAAKAPTTRQPLASRTPNAAAHPVAPKADNSTVAADDENWDSSSDDEAEPTAVADARQAATARAQAAVVVGLPTPLATSATVTATAVVPAVAHDPSSWDSDDSDDSDDAPATGPGTRRAALPPGARLKPDTDFAPAVGCMQPEAIGGAGYNGKLQKLKCTTCGTDVLRFANARWSDGTEGCEAVDYLFFRYFSGHSLDVNRLRERLLPDSAKAAYACQCSWQSVAGLKKLSAWGTPPGDEGGTGGGGTSLRWLPQED